jgi:hypothetical protein
MGGGGGGDKVNNLVCFDVNILLHIMQVAIGSPIALSVLREMHVS